MRPHREYDESDTEVGSASRFPTDLLYRAARLYYLEDATQAEVAAALGTSRPTVSRLLAEARATGIVHIEVREPRAADTTGLALALAQALGLHRTWITPSTASLPVGPLLAPGVAQALREADLGPGDAVLVSSGATVHAVAQRELTPLPGVVVAPIVGGRDEPEEYYQTNEITRQVALRVHGTPVFLYAPAMPGPALHEMLMKDETIQRVTGLWATARAAVLGIGAPPMTRTSLPSVLPRDAMVVSEAVGDIGSRPFDATGRPISFPGSERLVAMELEALTRIPHTIGVAVGAEKVNAILAAARAGYVNELVTDAHTARLLVERVGRVGS